jgi:hypothetical protein
MIDHLQQRFDGSFPLHEALTTIMAVDIGKTRYAGVMHGANLIAKEKRQHITTSQGLLVITIKPENSLSTRNFDAGQISSPGCTRTICT